MQSSFLFIKKGGSEQMIIKTTLTINGYKSKLSPKLQLYKGDSVFVEFTLLNSIISSINGVEAEETLPIDQLETVKLRLVTPNGTPTLESTKIVDNRVQFKILPEHTTETGEYSFQIICYDSDDCTFHIPPATYSIENPIGESE